VDGRREGIAGPVAWSKPTALSADGRTLVFGTTADFGRGKRLAGSYLLDLEADAVSVLPCGAERLWSFDASISADGRRIVVYHMQMPDADPRPSGIYLLDRDAGTATPLVAGPGEAAIEKAGMPCLSADGRWVVFCSLEVPGIAGGANDTRDVFRFDTVSRTVELVSVAEHGGSGNGVSDLWPGGRAVSADGRFVLFTSEASDLVAGDGNGLGDVFVRDMQAGSTVRVSLSRDGGDADAKSSWPAISSDGRRVAFTSEATNLVEGDRNGKEDVFVRELAWDD
jgi:Tol biopolymer transport system component